MAPAEAAETSAPQELSAEEEAKRFARGEEITAVLSVLNVNVRRGTVALFVCLEEDYTSLEGLTTTFRFAHLTFQEFLAGRFVEKRLRRAFKRAGREGEKSGLTRAGSP